MFTLQFDSRLFLFYTDSHLEEKKSIIYWPVQTPQNACFTYEEIEFTQFVNDRAGIKPESKPRDSVHTCPISISPRCLFRLKVNWPKEESPVVISWIHLSQLLTSCLLPGFQFRKRSLVGSHEVLVYMVFPSALGGKELNSDTKHSSSPQISHFFAWWQLL